MSQTITDIKARLAANQLGHGRFAAALDGAFGDEVKALAQARYAETTVRHRHAIDARRRKARNTVRRASAPKAVARTTEASNLARQWATEAGASGKTAAIEAWRLAKANPAMSARQAAFLGKKHALSLQG
jgi:hypothetical protein